MGAMHTRLGAVSTPQWMIIDLILRLKRHLWSQHVKRLGERVGLVEYDMISIVATATRILAMHALHPESLCTHAYSQWWQQFSMRYWLDLLLYQAVISNRTVFNPGRKRSVLLAAIRAEHTVDGVLCVSWRRAVPIFRRWFL